MRIKYSLIIILMISMIGLVIPMVLADMEYYKLNQETDLRFTCTLNNAIPTSATYNITITYPNGSNFINNQQATALGSGAFNYTTNFTEVGTYKVQMFCYDPPYSFSDEGFYTITSNGKAEPEGIVIVLFSIVFLIVIGFMLYQFILCFGHFASLDLDVVDLAKTMGIYFALLGLYFLSIFYLGNQTIEGFLLLGIQIGGFTHIIIPLVGFLISITIGSLKRKKMDLGTKRILRRQRVV